MADEIRNLIARERLGTVDPIGTARAMLTNPSEFAQIVYSQRFLQRVHHVEERYDVRVVATYDEILSFGARYAANDDGTFVLVVDRHDTRSADELYELFQKIWLEVTLLRKGTRDVLLKIAFKDLWFNEKDLVWRYAVYTGNYGRACVLVQNTQTL